MMQNFLWAMAASIVVSLISLIGVITLLFKENFLNKILILLVGFSAGGLIGGAFLHLLPEALEAGGNNIDIIFIYSILGFISFFILEKYLHWRHCHENECKVHMFTYLNLIGDGVHNFTDGLVIGASFIVSVQFGIITTLVIIFHEIPQEIGDFGLLVYGGFNKFKALFYNFICGLICVAGAMLGFFVSAKLDNFFVFLLPFTAGGFIYIAACDIIPELHKENNTKISAMSIAAFFAGILFIFFARLLFKH